MRPLPVVIQSQLIISWVAFLYQLPHTSHCVVTATSAPPLSKILNPPLLSFWHALCILLLKSFILCWHMMFDAVCLNADILVARILELIRGGSRSWQGEGNKLAKLYIGGWKEQIIMLVALLFNHLLLSLTVDFTILGAITDSCEVFTNMNIFLTIIILEVLNTPERC